MLGSGYLRRYLLLLVLVSTAGIFYIKREELQQFASEQWMKSSSLLPQTSSGSNSGSSSSASHDPADLKKLLDPPAEKLDLSPEANPFLEEYSEPDGDLIRMDSSDRTPATLIALVRNSEQHDIVSSVVQIEAAFNIKFNYPWTFFNDEDFTEEFKESVKLATGGNCSFELIQEKDWVEPDFIDKEKADKLNKEMETKDKVQYATKKSYHRMCRWNSGNFFTHPALDKYKYYWRVEPKTEYYCDIDYDVFAYMEDNDKDYGFVINLYDSPQSIKTLWPTVKEFFAENPDYLAENNALQWLTQDSRKDHNDIANGYSTCHFWSNFEIGSLDFFRSKRYQDYYNYLDKAGGFFYERWGDAPVHSIALALMTDKSRIHWFRDIGYFHAPYWNCPTSSKCRNCEAGKFSSWDGLSKENCLGEWFKVAGTD